MKKVSLSIAALVAAGLVAGSASAADLGAKVYKKAPPVAAFDPWDFAFGSYIASDYVFRGITQSAHKPSVNAYFEPRYNINKDLQLYVGSSWESISFPNRAASEVDIYGGVRPTFGAWAFDFGVFGYLYPGGQCFNVAAFCGSNIAFGALPLTGGNFAKKDASFYEGYGKVVYTVNDSLAVGGNVFYSPNFVNTGAKGTYASGTLKYTVPSTVTLPYGAGAYVSGEYGHQYLGTPDAFYFVNSPNFGSAGKYKGYNTWNVGVGFTKSVFTLDLRYSDTDYSKADCNYFTSDYTATSVNAAGATVSNWCGATFIAKLSADLTAMSNLK